MTSIENEEHLFENQQLLSSHYYTASSKEMITDKEPSGTIVIEEPSSSEMMLNLDKEEEAEIHKAKVEALIGILFSYVSLYFWLFSAISPGTEAVGIIGNILLWRHYQTYKDSAILILQKQVKWSLALAIIHIVSIVVILCLKIALVSLSIGIQIVLAILREVCTNSSC